VQLPSEESAAYRHAMLQLFILVSASTGMIIAVIIRQYRQAASDLALSNTQLELRVLERTRAIEAIETRFKTTFENAAVGMSILDGDAMLLRVNDRMAEMLGYRAAELEGRLLDQFTHPDDVADNRLAWEKLKSDSGDEYQLEKRYIRKDGEIVWGYTSISCVRRPNREIEYLIKVIQDITARKRSDDARQALLYELNHRSKNMLSIIQAIARQTAAGTPEQFVEHFSRRLHAMATNQDLLVKSGWESVSLEDLVRGQLSHFSGVLDQRVNVRGPPVPVAARSAQAIAMALHELGTNAAKHGSLSNDSGQVDISWSAHSDTFQMTWVETGGPRIHAPESSGFGSTVIESLIQSALAADVSVDFAPTGLVWKIKCSIASLRD
jgi:PAS domain S-box-containing protein